MRFIEIIIENSQDKIAKLYNPAIKANDNPDNGITIQNKSAYYVIRDCAYITRLYLPLMVFENYKNPFEELKGKFKRKEIEEFINYTKNNINASHLLTIILNKIPKEQEVTTEYNQKMDFDPNDPYGDYGTSSSIETMTINKSLLSTLDLLCAIFDAK
jgi:hypothetical protein